MEKTLKEECIKTIESGIDFLETHAQDLMDRDIIYNKMDDQIDNLKEDSYNLEDLKKNLIYMHDKIETETKSMDTVREINNKGYIGML